MVSQYLRSTFSSFREYLTPVTHTSTFAQTGEITPEEFVQAGDYLVYKFPTWQWSPAPEAKRRDFLPEDKQFLVTRHVPSYVRASDYEEGETATDTVEDFADELSPDEGWTSPGTKTLPKHCTPNDERRHSIEYSKVTGGATVAAESNNEDKNQFEDDDYLNDIDELIDDDAEEAIEDETKNQKNLAGEIINDPKKRSYDLYITYSTSYRVPKMYILGFNSNGAPLSPQQMFEDIASDYRHKTVTIEKAPFLTDTTVVSIHPCRHSTVMRALMKMAAKRDISKNAEDQKDIVKGLSKLGLADNEDAKKSVPAAAPAPASVGDSDEEWESLQEEQTGSIRVDQYLIIFLKFMASVTPGIEYDYTMDAL